MLSYIEILIETLCRFSLIWIKTFREGSYVFVMNCLHCLPSSKMLLYYVMLFAFLYHCLTYLAMGDNKERSLWINFIVTWYHLSIVSKRMNVFSLQPVLWHGIHCLHIMCFERTGAMFMKEREMLQTLQEKLHWWKFHNTIQNNPTYTDNSVCLLFNSREMLQMLICTVLCSVKNWGNFPCQRTVKIGLVL